MWPLCWWGPRETAQRAHAFRRHWYQGVRREDHVHIPHFSSVYRGRMQKKTSPQLPHTLTFVTVEDDPLLGTKKIETAEIFVWKQKICSESQCVLLVSFINLPPHILVDSWSSSFLSTSKDCPPPHFLTHSHTSVYELFNFKIVSQKVVHVCIILYSQIYF